MNSRQLFRQSGMIIRTRSRFTEALWPTCGVLLMLSVFALGALLDIDSSRFAAAEQAAQQQDTQHQAELRSAHEAGRQLGRAQMVNSARAVWQAALEQGQQMCQLQSARRGTP